ncbi:MAG: POTRA domain-containing protein [Desulfurobacteriaceae bacterium]
MRLIFLLLFILFPCFAFSATVERIEIEGLKWTKEEFVRRELLLKPGEEFSEEKLRESVRNLLNTHLFYEVKPSVKRFDGKVVVRLKIRERFPVVPLPKLRLKSDGSYRAGLEVRDYNVGGMGHRLYAGYVKWFNSDHREFKYYLRLYLYRLLNDVDFGIGAYRSLYSSEDANGKEYTVSSVSVPVYMKRYLDPKKVNQLSLGFTPVRLRYTDPFKDRDFYYTSFTFVRDSSTDRVYFVEGRRYGISLSYSVPSISSVSTGSVRVSYSNSIAVKGAETKIYELFLGTKLGYRSDSLLISAPLSGYRESKVLGEKYAVAGVSYRKPLIDKWLFVKPSVRVGDAFDSSPDDLLVSVGLEVEAFWVKLVDGIIRFKLFRGLGPGGDTSSSFKLSFRW